MDQPAATHDGCWFRGGPPGPSDEGWPLPLRPPARLWTPFRDWLGSPSPSPPPLGKCGSEVRGVALGGGGGGRGTGDPALRAAAPSGVPLCLLSRAGTACPAAGGLEGHAPKLLGARTPHLPLPVLRAGWASEWRAKGPRAAPRTPFPPFPRQVAPPGSAADEGGSRHSRGRLAWQLPLAEDQRPAKPPLLFFGNFTDPGGFTGPTEQMQLPAPPARLHPRAPPEEPAGGLPGGGEEPLRRRRSPRPNGGALERAQSPGFLRATASPSSAQNALRVCVGGGASNPASPPPHPLPFRTSGGSFDLEAQSWSLEGVA